MTKINKLFLAIALASTVYASGSYAGTVMYVSSQASDNGTSYLSFSIDKKVSPDVKFVEAKDHNSEDMREIYENGDPNLKVLGQIPEVTHTYSYIRTDYGVINENSLMLGLCENTSTHKFAKSEPSENAILSLEELTRIALERCVRSKEAIDLLGQLIDNYGYYGSPASIVIADKDEAYDFEVMPSANHKGGYYVARKIPQGHFFVAADQFRIHSIDKNDPDFVVKDKLISDLKRDEIDKYSSDKINWIKSVKGSEIRPYYSLRRVWRALSLVAPSKDLSPWVKGYASDKYPFSVEPEKKISLIDLITLTRDTYTGTQFDNATKNTGGLFATPYTHEEYGERSIANENTTYTFISQINEKLPSAITWLSLGPSGEGTFVPLTVNKIPEMYSGVNRTEYNEQKMWWLNKRIAHLAVGYYSSLSDMLKTRNLEQEQHSITLLNHSKGLPKNRFNKVVENNTKTAFNRMEKLYENLLEKHDGGFMIRYAEGHNPKFIPVDSYKKHKPVHVEKKEEKSGEKNVSASVTKTEGIPFYNAIGLDKSTNNNDMNASFFSRILHSTQDYLSHHNKKNK